MTKPHFVNPSNEDDLQWKTTSNIKIWISQKLLIGSYSNLKLRLRRPNQSIQILQMKTTSHGRWPQNIKSGTSQQPLIGSYSNFKLKLRLPKIKFTNPWNEEYLQWKTTSKYQKRNISTTNVWNMTENSEEISSVALLSPAC